MLIDASACAKRIQVTAILTTSVEGSSWPSLEVFERTGAAQPHPELELHLDAHGTVESSHADLAVIVLEEPIRGDISPSPLADTEPRTGELLSVAGYGTEEGLVRLFGNRYFRGGKVRSPPVPPDDRIPYEPQGVHFNPSYRGGPCLLANEKDRSLVGIVGLGKEQEMSCTSTSRYRSWLRAFLQAIDKQ
jgi:hypothetical protein